MSKRHALIIGAGIGGLSTAAALERIGWSVAIYERAPASPRSGAGIVLAPNALAVLEQLGAAGKVRNRGARVGCAEILRQDGRPITAVPVQQQAQRYGTYSYLIHRETLQSVLAGQLERTAVHYGKQLVDLYQQGNEVTAVFADGTSACGQLLIGADGIHSAVRRKLPAAALPAGGDALRYAGFTALRGICTLGNLPYSSEEGGGFEAWGSGLRFGLSHLGEGRVFWFAALNAEAGGQHSPSSAKAALLARVQNWYEPVAQAVSATPEAVLLQHDIYDRAPLRCWSFGSVTLLGDAAHPMLPNLGQGGAQALEDAAQLAACLRERPGDVPAALAAYEAARIPRTSRIVRQSRRMGRVAQLENRLAVSLRNSVLRAMPSPLQLQQLDWLIGYRPAEFQEHLR
ncbi:FAD-dependent monooxygenase [Paenibacillus sp. SYP-B4298]|uniref:FAD-dependent monooxygenase n=1 Tax=Paenibacillus sp. SYP-B4298 TaxID=2996034 RepID=UPI0022DD134A|nr:FAD-dependent monooxygenase [Paenibacillus sp. SYP-B4298]